MQCSIVKCRKVKSGYMSPLESAVWAEATALAAPSCRSGAPVADVVRSSCDDDDGEQTGLTMLPVMMISMAGERARGMRRRILHPDRSFCQKHLSLLYTAIQSLLTIRSSSSSSSYIFWIFSSIISSRSPRPICARPNSSSCNCDIHRWISKSSLPKQFYKSSNKAM